MRCNFRPRIRLDILAAIVLHAINYNRRARHTRIVPYDFERNPYLPITANIPSQPPEAVRNNL